ncbi:MAG: hypothetical protein FJX75_08385 [Armatimonadetes bacterium]|nr:hypothetical protein [Armatimonadota bacterium]
MASSTYHAFPYCVRGYRFTLPVVLLDADGDPTAPSDWDSEISTGGGAFADCTEEVVAPSGAAGEGYLTLTGDETNTALALVRVKDTGATVKTSEYAFVPTVLPTVESGTAQAGASTTITLASGASAISQFYRGMLIGTTGGTGGGGGSGKQSNQLRVITDYNNSTKVATVFPQWETTPSNDTTYDIYLPSGMPHANVGRWLGTDLATPATAGYPAVTIKVGTGTGELDLVSGAVKLASAAVQAIWDALTSAMTAAGSIGKKLADWALGSDSKVLLSANAQTGVTIPTVTTLTNKPMGYQDGAVWIDTVGGTAGTTSYVNGTADKPVNTLADALTIATAVGLRSLHLSPDSSVTLTASVAGWTIRGGTVALNGQTVTGARFENCSLSGTASGAMTCVDCIIGAITGLSGMFVRCQLAGHCTLATGNHTFAFCYPGTSATTAPNYTFSSGTTRLWFRFYSGGLNVFNMAAEHILRYDCITGGLTVDSGCTGGNVIMRGLCSLTDNSGGKVTITRGSGMTISTDADGRAYLADEAIGADQLDSSMDTYQAKVWFIDDDEGSNDRYVVAWFRNSQPITSGITSPTIHVIKAADGTDLVGETAMAEVGSTGLYRYSEGTNRVASGAAYFARATATIDSVTRTWYQPIGRDS